MSKTKENHLVCSKR